MNSQKRCLITGASGGIGGAIAKMLDSQGYQVVIQGRNELKLAKLKSQLSDQASMLIGDLNDAQQRQLVLQEAFRQGPISLLVNAAGISSFCAFESLSSEDMHHLIETNLLMPMMMTQDFINISKLHSSKANSPSQVTIVNVGSAFGYIGYPGFSGYCASKFGLRGLTESLAREYSDSPFKFKYFAPRATQTDINSAAVDQMNAELGNAVDSSEYVAQQFSQFLAADLRQKVVGWPEKLFVRINAILPAVVDNAIASKLATIKRFLPTS